MFKRIFSGQKGVTLVEIIIYIGVVSVVSVGVILIAVQLINLKTRADAYGIISSEATNLLEGMITDVRSCDSFALTESTLQITNGAEVWEYSLSGGQVFLTTGGQSYPITSDQVEISNLTFEDWTSPDSADLVHIEFEISRGVINEQFQSGIHKR